MARVDVQLPGLVAEALGVSRVHRFHAVTLADVLEQLSSRLPGLRMHLYDESGAFRQHVLCFLNETSVRWMASLDVAVHDGDQVTLVQAVSGGVSFDLLRGQSRT